MLEDIRSIVSEKQFQRDVEQSPRPAVVNYYAMWCPYCRQIDPVISKLANEYGQELDFYKVDIDDHPELAEKYGVEGTPTVVLFEHGEISHFWIGEMDERQYREAFESVHARH